MILPSDPRAFLGQDAISYSEASTLAQCERKWAFAYTGERQKSEGSKAMQLGSELHRLWGAWWQYGNYTMTKDETAAWLMARYAQHYTSGAQGLFMRHGAQGLFMRHVEMPVAVRLPWGPYFFGFLDGLLLNANTGELWVAELKTAAQLSAVNYLTQSNQMPLYVWAARQAGYPVVGAMLDVIRTYRPVKKELPLAESFDRRWLRFEDGEVERALREMQSAVDLRSQILEWGRAPMRAVGPSCAWCPFASPCQGLDVDIVAEDTEF